MDPKSKLESLRLHINDTAPKFMGGISGAIGRLRLHINDTAPKCQI